MPRWEWIPLVYFSYLAIVALSRQRFARARTAALAAAALAWVGVAVVGPVQARGTTTEVVLPSVILLVGYWLSGLFFVQPMATVERWLLDVDRRVLEGSGVLPWYRNAPLVVHQYFELVYLLVYLVVPAGALVLMLRAEPEDTARYWWIVLLAELSSYAALPWVQTRPPRAITPGGGDASSAPSLGGLVRRLNVAVLQNASITVNTLPSGHAAGAVAAAMAVSTSLPGVGLVFGVLAGSIVLATVFGRYHYLVDSLLGVAVAVMAWGAAAAVL